MNTHPDIAALEDGIAELARLAPRDINPADLGKLTSEAVLAQFDHAAKAVEAMGVAVRESAAKMEAAMKDHTADLELISKAAEHIRQKGANVQAQIEQASALTAEIREACAQFQKEPAVA